MLRTRALGAVLVAALLTGCGGGGGSMTPAGPGNIKSTQSGTVKITLTVPPPQRQSSAAIAHLQSEQQRHLKHPQYLSGSTTELDFTLISNNGTAVTPSEQATFDFSIFTSSSSECTGSSTNGYECTVTAPAPVGADSYVIAAEQCSVSGSGPNASCASLGGTLTTLSQTYKTISVALDQTVVAAFTLSPVVASIDWAPVTYANVSGPSPMVSSLWLSQPNGAAIPKYAASPSPGAYSCSTNVGSGSGNGCYEPVGQGTSIAFGEQLEARDATGAVIIGASGGSIYQTPLYLDQSGHAITISWSCHDATGGTSLTWETGGGPYTSNASATAANQSFNSPVANPASDPDGGNTVDGNGNPVTAVGNNGIEMSWDGVDQPLLGSPDSCSATTSNGLSTSADFYVGLGEGGVSAAPGTAPDATMYVLYNHVNSIGDYDEDLYGYQPSELSGTPSIHIAFGACVHTHSKICFGAYKPALTVDASGNLWGNFPATSSGDVAKFTGLPGNGASPSTWISTPASSIGGTDGGLAIDSSGNIYIADTTNNSIDIYAPGTAGSATPTATISGSNTQLAYPTQVALDASGNIWALNTQLPISAALVEFPAHSTGNVAPSATLLTPTWESACGSLGTPEAFAFDPKGNIIVSSDPGVGSANPAKNDNIIILPLGANNGTCPIGAFNAQFVTNDIAVDDVGYLYLGGGPAVYIYPEFSSNGSSGSASPYEVVSQPSTSTDDAAGAIAISTASGWRSGDARAIRR